MGILDPKPLTQAAAATSYAPKSLETSKLDKTEAAASYARLGNQTMRGPIDPRSILAPGAPLERKTAATPPTVAIATTNPQASGRQVPLFISSTGLPNTKYFGFAAGADWRPTSAGAISGWANQTGLTGSTNTFSPAAVILGFDGTTITFMLKSNNSHRYRISVDGEYVNQLDVAGPGGATTQYLTLTFATAKAREIRFEQINGFMYGVYVGIDDTLPWAVKPRGPRVAVLGDSYTAGDDPATVGYSAFTSGLAIAADRLGWGDLINGAIAGTGWIVRVGVNNNIQDKVAQLITWAPEVVIIATGHNDGSESPANITAAVTASLNAIRAGLPNVPIIILGPLFAGAPVDGARDTVWGPIQDAMFAGVLPAHRAVTIDTVNAAIFTGTGKSGTPGTGNGNTYMQAETVATHPTRAGADYLGERLTRSLLATIAAL